MALGCQERRPAALNTRSRNGKEGHCATTSTPNFFEVRLFEQGLEMSLLDWQPLGFAARLQQSKAETGNGKMESFFWRAGAQVRATPFWKQP